jgi:2C-methyl-D-erythritol 2,4-cyclodiphosphate synthase
MKEKIAELCKVAPHRVNIKAKTNERMGFTGRGEGVVAMVVCEILQNA